MAMQMRSSLMTQMMSSSVGVLVVGYEHITSCSCRAAAAAVVRMLLLMMMVLRTKHVMMQSVSLTQ